MPPLASPQPQPTFLGTPFATPRTQSPFEYPHIASPPSPIPHPYNHHNWTAPYTMSLKTVMPARPPPVPPTLLIRARACPEGGPVMVDSTRLAGLEALAREMQVQQARIRRENTAESQSGPTHFEGSRVPTAFVCTYTRSSRAIGPVYRLF